MDKDQFEKGVNFFDSGEYFEAHEVWEDLWNEATGAEHAYLQGLIQAAVAMHHAGNANWNGSRKLFASALGYLEKGKTEARDVDLELLKNHILDFEAAIQRVLGGDTAAELPFFRLPRK